MSHPPRRSTAPWALAVLFAGAGLALPAHAAAQDVEPTPETEYRAALMVSLQNHMRALGALVAGDVAFSGHVQYHASAVHGIATMAGDAFPEGSGGAGSRSADSIWEKWDAFLEKLQVLQDGAAALDAAAQAGDMAAVEEARGQVGSSCRSCHTDFRLREPAGG
ncbi:MAG: cytochrome c [Gemmatimonadetes bacterium]|nr:cytochrome c [Gemmatimonadota bacterium]